MHGHIWHYLFEVRHFHYMTNEHISEYSSSETFCISVCSSLYVRAITHSLRAPDLSTDFHSPFDLVVDLYELHTGVYPHFLGSSDLSRASLSFDLVVILRHIPSSQVCLHFYLSYPLSHLIRSSSCQFSLSFWDGTYINRSSSYKFNSVWVFGTAPISIDNSSCLVSSAWLF